MKIRDFEYKGIKFHLNDNGGPGSQRREIEGKYLLLFYNESYDRWQSIGAVDSKKEAILTVKELYKTKTGCFSY